jgi:hypothetical protein
MGPITRIPLLALLALAAPVAFAHGGRTNAQGCHNDRVHGGYHCHGTPAAAPARAPARRQPLAPRSTGGGDVGYANCTAARAAGAAPVRRGDPGYAAHLDRDNDGIGCE